MAQINFVRERRKQLDELDLKDRRYFTITSWIVGGVLIIFLAVFGYRLYLSSQIAEMKSEQERLEKRVLAQEEREKEFVIFVNKLETLAAIFPQRKNKQEAIDYFSGVFDDDVLVERIAYQADDEALTFTIRSNSVFAMDQVFELLESQQTKQTFPNLEKSSLQRGNDGSYSIQVVVILGEDETS